MSETKTPWTPGPWRAIRIPGLADTTRLDGVYAEGHGYICEIGSDGPNPERNARSEANALLIAASPAMAEALEPFKRALAWFESRMGDDMQSIDEKTHMIGCEITVSDLRRAVDALALARGETK